LCARIGILIRGKFVAVGSPAMLKAKYGKGFRVAVRFDEGNKEAVHKAVNELLGPDVEVEELAETDTTVFTISNWKFSYSKAYHLF
jgi:ATP-binding cassette subfamily A (ABC1) protein 3